MTLIDNEYYYENTAGINLTHKSSDIILKAIFANNAKCAQCGSRINIMTMNDGTFLYCTEDMYGHDTGWDIKYSRGCEPPKLIRIKLKMSFADFLAHINNSINNTITEIEYFKENINKEDLRRLNAILNIITKVRDI